MMTCTNCKTQIPADATAHWCAVCRTAYCPQCWYANACGHAPDQATQDLMRQIEEAKDRG